MVLWSDWSPDLLVHRQCRSAGGDKLLLHFLLRFSPAATAKVAGIILGVMAGTAAGFGLIFYAVKYFRR